MDTLDLAIYAGAVVWGCIVGYGVAGAVAAWAERLGEVRGWSRTTDVVAVAVAWLLAVTVAGLGGAVYGAESETLAHSWQVGALWSVCGAVASPWLHRRLRAATGRVVRRAAP